jgi:hypothetical protein
MPNPNPNLPANSYFAALRKLESQVANLTAQLQNVRMQGGSAASLPGNYAGKPIPSMIGQEVVVPAGVTTQLQINITVAAEGAFAADSIHFAYRPTAGVNAGYWRPISGVNDIAVDGLLEDVFNFYWEYQVSGSHRQRQDIPVPSSLIDRYEEGGGRWQLHIEDVFSPTATIALRITPTRAMTNAGILYAGFRGSYLLE